MAHEGGYYRFFAYLNLFMFFMLVLVLGASFLLLFVGWEGVGQIGLPFSESGANKILPFSLPRQDGATIVASVTPSLPLAGSLHLRVEEIAPTDQEAASQAAALNTLVGLARWELGRG